MLMSKTEVTVTENPPSDDMRKKAWNQALKKTHPLVGVAE